jgi:hypothetical protein
MQPALISVEGVRRRHDMSHRCEQVRLLEFVQCIHGCKQHIGEDGAGQPWMKGWGQDN